MPDTIHAAAGEWRRARLTAELLREQLAALGVPPEDTRGITARSDMGGRAYVYLGTFTVGSADLLLAAMSGRTAPAEVTS
jgi:hypothetical protein